MAPRQPMHDAGPYSLPGVDPERTANRCKGVNDFWIGRSADRPRDRGDGTVSWTPTVTCVSGSPVKPYGGERRSRVSVTLQPSLVTRASPRAEAIPTGSTALAGASLRNDAEYLPLCGRSPSSDAAAQSSNTALKQPLPGGD